MSLQNLFYLIAIITFSLFALFLLLMVAIALSIQAKINKVSRRVHLITDELGSLLKDSKSYTKYLGASIGVSILGKILKILKQ